MLLLVEMMWFSSGLERLFFTRDLSGLRNNKPRRKIDMRKLSSIILFVCFYTNLFSQGTNKKVYFLADTLSVSKENNVLKHGYVDNAFEYFFTFFCKCAYPYQDYVIFSYINKKGEPKAEIVLEKPKYRYSSFKELMDMVNEHHKFFNDVYDLYMVEALPENKYRTNQVKFVGHSPPIADGVIIKQ